MDHPRPRQMQLQQPSMGGNPMMNSLPSGNAQADHNGGDRDVFYH